MVDLFGFGHMLHSFDMAFHATSEDDGVFFF